MTKPQQFPSPVVFLGGRGGPRVLFAGNSITRHAPKPEIGWTANWGMAASTEDKDYVHRVLNALRVRDPGTEGCIAQLAAWERQYWQGRDILNDYRAAADFASDLIIVRLAENVPREKLDAHPFAPAYAELLDFLNPHQRARVIVTTSFWQSDSVDQAIRQVAAGRGLPVVELAHLGQRDEMKAIGLFEHSGVAAHPGDAGMAAIAAAILEQVNPGK
ncbi:MAG: hypothetical protein PHG76_07875 [Eubacteriales bacterium]|nr:hypothetical protein [Eubacteriales bacterium]